MKGLFITGTGTNVGKTVTSAALMHRFRRVAPLRYWKPVQTGAPPDDDTAEVRSLGKCASEEICTSGLRFPRPLSPHLAAELCGASITISELVEMAIDAEGNCRWLVEGAGGVLVPLNRSELMTDLISALGLPAVIVASSQLGTINHTLLTIEALRHRSIGIAGVIINGDRNTENRRAIETYGCVPVLGEMPNFVTLDPDAVADWAANQLDRDGAMERFF